MACNSEEVGERPSVGRRPPGAVDCFDRLPVEVADRKLGVEPVPKDARLAKALDVFSRASDASDRLLLLWVRLVELEWWWYGGRTESVRSELGVVEESCAVSDEISLTGKFGGVAEVMESLTVTSLGSDMGESENRAGKDVQDFDGFRTASHSYWVIFKGPEKQDWRSTVVCQQHQRGASPQPTKSRDCSPRDHEDSGAT